ncbi:hypothetical protein [Glycomyces sp. MUSA5-2]|uniref:hypothetical protein n=1 Tax=Glycomyces sp. MUSA5-2 TaxID=2053002 RepID=UPI00300BD877
MPAPTRLRFPAAAAAAAALLASCSSGSAAEDPGGTAPGPGAIAEAERLYQIVNDSRATTDELTDIEQRVAKRCMEDEGFTVHYPPYFQESAFGTYGAAGYLTDAPVRAVPTPEAAEQWGFGVWTEFTYVDEDAAAELLTPEARIAFNLPDLPTGPPDTSEWDAESDAYQADWIKAYTGAPAITSDLKGPEPDTTAPPGGCWLAMVETIYGEPYMIESDGESYPATHRPSPASTVEDFEDTGELSARLDGEIADFDACLAESGHEGWELGDDLYPPLWQYFGGMYDPAYFEEYGDEEGIEVPDLPDDAPADFAGVLDLERAMAVDFAACGQETGLRQAVEEGWAAMLVDAFAPIEADMTAWQEEMQAHLDAAQDYLQE